MRFSVSFRSFEFSLKFRNAMMLEKIMIAEIRRNEKVCRNKSEPSEK
jgi:hypothetical protein